MSDHTDAWPFAKVANRDWRSVTLADVRFEIVDRSATWIAGRFDVVAYVDSMDRLPVARLSVSEFDGEGSVAAGWYVGNTAVSKVVRRKGLASAMLDQARRHVGQEIRFHDAEFTPDGAAWARTRGHSVSPDSGWHDGDMNAWITGSKQHTGIRAVVSMTAGYTVQDIVNVQAPFRGQKLNEAAATNFMRRLLRGRVPQGDLAYVDYSHGLWTNEREAHATVAWDTSTRPPTPVIAAGAIGIDSVTLLHECAHFIQQGTYRGQVGSWDQAHPREWLEIYADLVGTWGSAGLAAALRKLLTKQASKTASADTGYPEVDKLIEDFKRQPGISGYRDGEVAHGYCQVVAEEFVDFCKTRGMKAYTNDVYLDEIGYSIQPGSKGGEIGFDENDEMIYGHYPEHTIVALYPDPDATPYGGPAVYVDFTASQYGYSEFPKVFSSLAKTAASERASSKTAYQFSSIKLYHGTVGYYADKILRGGLTPRTETGVTNHWADSAISHDGKVYLSASNRMTISRRAYEEAYKVVRHEVFGEEEGRIKRDYQEGCADLWEQIFGSRPRQYSTGEYDFTMWDRDSPEAKEYYERRQPLIDVMVKAKHVIDNSIDPRLRPALLEVTLTPDMWKNLTYDEDTRFGVEPLMKKLEERGISFPEWMASLGSDAVVAYVGSIPAGNITEVSNPEGRNWELAIDPSHRRAKVATKVEKEELRGLAGYVWWNGATDTIEWGLDQHGTGTPPIMGMGVYDGATLRYQGTDIWPANGHGSSGVTPTAWHPNVIMTLEKLVDAYPEMGRWTIHVAAPQHNFGDHRWIDVGDTYSVWQWLSGVNHMRAGSKTTAASDEGSAWRGVRVMFDQPGPLRAFLEAVASGSTSAAIDVLVGHMRSGGRSAWWSADPDRVTDGLGTFWSTSHRYASQYSSGVHGSDFSVGVILEAAISPSWGDGEVDGSWVTCWHLGAGTPIDLKAATAYLPSQDDARRLIEEWDLRIEWFEQYGTPVDWKDAVTYTGPSGPAVPLPTQSLQRVASGEVQLMSGMNDITAMVGGEWAGKITWTTEQDRRAFTDDWELALGDHNGYHRRIQTLVVEPRFRRQGIATALMDAFVAETETHLGKNAIDPGKFTPDGAAFWGAWDGEVVRSTERMVYAKAKKKTAATKTDWADALRYVTKVYRGFGVHLTPEQYSTLFESDDLNRAAGLALSLVSQRGLGMHWTINRNEAAGFAGWASDKGGARIIVTASAPNPEDVLVGEEAVGYGIQPFDHKLGEQEVPVRPGTEMHIRAIEWAPGGVAPMFRDEDGGGWLFHDVYRGKTAKVMAAREVPADQVELRGWYHGTSNSDVGPGTILTGGNTPASSPDGSPDNDLVWVSDNAWQASKYGSRTFQVFPKGRVQYRHENHEFWCDTAEVWREVDKQTILDHSNRLASKTAGWVTAKAKTAKTYTVPGGSFEGPLYHGSYHPFQVGDLVEPGVGTASWGLSNRRYTYCTPWLEMAGSHGPAVYEVEPLGELRSDPNFNPPGEWYNGIPDALVSEQPLRVVRVIHEAEFKQMLDQEYEQHFGSKTAAGREMTWEQVKARYPVYASYGMDHAVNELAHISDGEMVTPLLAYTEEQVDLRGVRFQRYPSDDARMASLMEGYQSGGEVPPVLLVERAGEIHTVDGHHRLSAQEELGRTLVPAVVAHSLREDKYSGVASIGHTKTAALPLENTISVAEQVMERAGLHGGWVDIPTGHVDDPAYQAAIAPLVEKVRKITGQPNLRFYASDYTLDLHGAQASADINSIVVRPRTCWMTILHECAHVILLDRMGPSGSGHSPEFARTARDLYARHISPEAGEKFWALVGPKAEGHMAKVASLNVTFEVQKNVPMQGVTRGGRRLVARVDGKYAGEIVYKEQRQSAHIGMIRVAPSFARQGVGTALLEEFHSMYRFVNMTPPTDDGKKLLDHFYDTHPQYDRPGSYGYVSSKTASWGTEWDEDIDPRWMAERHGPRQMSVEQAKAQGFTDGPYFHSTDHAGAILAQGFRQVAAEDWEVDDWGTMEEYLKFGGPMPVFFGASYADVQGYGSETIEVWARPGKVKGADGMTMNGGSFADVEDVVPIGIAKAAVTAATGNDPVFDPSDGSIPHELWSVSGIAFDQWTAYDAMGLDWGDDADLMRNMMKPGTPMVEVEFPNGERKRYIDDAAARRAVRRAFSKYGGTTATMEHHYSEQGQVGNRSHETQEDRGTCPMWFVRDMDGMNGETPGAHRNRHGQEWEDFKADIATNGMTTPILILVYPGEPARIAEGNHRRDAALELGWDEIPAVIRYFGHEERTRRIAVKTAVGDYGGEHQPPSNGPFLYDLTTPHLFPDGVYGRLHEYVFGDHAAESIRIIENVRDNPDARVTIYRSAPPWVPPTIETGNWVSITRGYAAEHGMGRIAEYYDPDEEWKIGDETRRGSWMEYDEARDWPIYAAEVRAADVRCGGNDLIEWGYWGPPVQARVITNELPPDRGDMLTHPDKGGFRQSSRERSQRAARLGGARLWWRIHPGDRGGFQPEMATSAPAYANPTEKATLAQAGYSCFPNPWHLVSYFVDTRLGIPDDAIVVGFTGRQSGTGLDGEPLVVPDMNVVYEHSWADFEREMLDGTPFPHHPWWGNWQMSGPPDDAGWGGYFSGDASWGQPSVPSKLQRLHDAMWTYGQSLDFDEQLRRARGSTPKTAGDEAVTMYHGTLHSRVEEIERFGLKPNDLGMVYLTDTEARADQWANRRADSTGGGPVVVEVRLDADDLTSGARTGEYVHWGPIPASAIVDIYEADPDMQFEGAKTAGTEIVAPGEPIYRGYAIDFPEPLLSQMRALLQPPETVEQIGQHTKVGPMIVDYLKSNHWDPEFGLGRSWTTNKRMAQSVQGPGWVVILTGHIENVDAIDHNAGPGYNYPSEKEVTLKAGAAVVVDKVEVEGLDAFAQRDGLLDRPIRAMATTEGPKADPTLGWVEATVAPALVRA